MRRRYCLSVGLILLSACVGPPPKPESDVGGAGSAGSRPSGAGEGAAGAARPYAAGDGGAGGTGGTGGSDPTDDVMAVGHPCKSSADCAGSECLRQGWCAVTCGDNSRCGKSASGIDNQCGADLTDATKNVCFVSCKSKGDCAAYPKTTCQPIIGLPDVSTCEVPGDTGFPCENDLNCAASLACIGGLWCSPTSCSSDADCGASASNLQNRCARSGKLMLCYPGCVTNDDCTLFMDTTCQPIPGGSNKACFKVSIGQKCTQDSDCGSYKCNAAATGSGWCTPSNCSSDADCGTGLTGRPNRCFSNGSNVKVCFPGCANDSDCSAYPLLTCDTDQTCSRPQ